MLRDYELFHGAIIRAILVKAERPIIVRIDDPDGRINSFVLDDSVAVNLKHSEKKLSPWIFSFAMDHINELIHLKERYEALLIGLICWRDGVVFLSPQQFLEITTAKEDKHWVRVERGRNEMYSV